MQFKLPFTGTQTPCSAMLFINWIHNFNISSKIDYALTEIWKEANFTAWDWWVARLSW
jgi:hypothetical protein